MTLAAIWRNDEQRQAPRLWMATDSRISDNAGRLIDEGIKLYEVPVVCRAPGPSGFVDTPYFVSSVGLVGAGSSLVYQHVYGTLVPILGNLVGAGDRYPSVSELAELAASVLTRYVRSLGERRPADAAKVTIAVGGENLGAEVDAYKLAPRIDDNELLSFGAEWLDLQSGRVHFIGDHINDAVRLLEEIESRDEPGAPRKRAALNVIRAMIDDAEATTIGGEVQVGFTTGAGFRRVASVTPKVVGEPTAVLSLNSIDLAELGMVGPCGIGIEGMVTPPSDQDAPP